MSQYQDYQTMTAIRTQILDNACLLADVESCKIIIRAIDSETAGVYTFEAMLVQVWGMNITKKFALGVANTRLGAMEGLQLDVERLFYFKHSDAEF